MLEYLLYIVSIATAGLLVGYVVGSRITRKREARMRLRVSTAMTQAHDMVEALKHQMQLISDHSQEYCHTLILSDFPQLREIVSVLEGVLAEADTLRQNGEMAGALAIFLWVRHPGGRAPGLRCLSKEQRDIVSTWIPQSRALLVQIAQALEQSHEKNQETGIRRRRRDRRSTEIDLRRLRDYLISS